MIGPFEKIEGIGLDQGMARLGDAVKRHVLSRPTDGGLRPVDGDGSPRTACSSVAGEGAGVAEQVQEILSRGHIPHHPPGVPVIGKEPGVDIVVEVDVKRHILFGDNDLLIRGVDPLIAHAVTAAGKALLEVDLLHGDIQGRRCRGPHHGQPFGGRLPPRVFSDDQVAGIPVDNCADLGNIPVIQSERLDVLAGISPVQVFEPFFDPVAEHFGLAPIFLRRDVIRHGALLFPL